MTQSPSTVVSKLNENVTLACRLSHTPDQVVSGVILYWYRLGPKQQEEYVYPPTLALPEYENRVEAVSPNDTAVDSSVVLLNVSWTDRHEYRCLLSYRTQKVPARKRGSGVLLLLHGNQSFARTHVAFTLYFAF